MVILKELRSARGMFNTGFHISVDAKCGIPANTKHVNVVVEIAPRGTDHFTPYMRFPRIGAFSDWDDAASLAIRLEWVENGEWKTVYIQQHRLFVSSLSAKGKAEAEYLKTAYVSASQLLESLLRFTYTGDLPSWKNNPQRGLLIRQAAYNHMEQSMDMRTPPPIERAMPRLRSPTEVRGLLINHYGNELIFGPVPPGLFAQRLNCDVCFGMVSSSASYPFYLT